MIPGPCDAQVSLVDVYPTVLELAGIECDSPIEGRCLVLAMRGKAFEIVPVFSETRLRDPLRRCVRTPAQKVIVSSDGSRELYDLRRDPGELVNRASSDQAVLSELEGGLSAFASRCREIREALVTPETESKRPLDRETFERLRALGYLK